MANDLERKMDRRTFLKTTLKATVFTLFNLATASCSFPPPQAASSEIPASPTPTERPSKTAIIPSPTKAIFPETKTPSLTPTPPRPTATPTLTETPKPSLTPIVTETLKPTPTSTVTETLRPTIPLTPTKEPTLSIITPPEIPIPDEAKKIINDSTAIINFYGEGPANATAVHLGKGRFLTCKHGLDAVGNLNPQSVEIELGHPAYRFFKAELAFYPQNETDLIIVQINLEKGGYGTVAVGNPKELKTNDQVIVMNYQINVRQESGAIHFHRARLLGLIVDQGNELIFIAENLDPEVNIKTIGDGGSGGGLFYLDKNGQPRVAGIAMGVYDKDYSQIILKNFNVQSPPKTSVAIFTSVTNLPLEWIK